MCWLFIIPSPILPYSVQTSMTGAFLTSSEYQKPQVREEMEKWPSFSLSLLLLLTATMEMVAFL